MSFFSDVLIHKNVLGLPDSFFHFLENKEFSALSVLIWGLFCCLSVHYWESCSYPTTIWCCYKAISFTSKFLNHCGSWFIKLLKAITWIFPSFSGSHCTQYTLLNVIRLMCQWLEMEPVAWNILYLLLRVCCVLEKEERTAVRYFEIFFQP